MGSSDHAKTAALNGLGELGLRQTRDRNLHKGVTSMRAIARDGSSLPPKLKNVGRAVIPAGT